jgi:GST-like protein
MIELFAANTPNNIKVIIALEELGTPYEMRPIRIQDDEQKEPWFLKINPNGRTPAMIDRGNGDFPVFESGAMLIYLAEEGGRLLPSDRKKRSEVIQWLMFQMSGVGPMQGQVNVFLRNKEQIPFAIERYTKETIRLYKVLDSALAEREYLAGDYSIADMATWPWVRIHGHAKVSIDEMPNLKRWVEAMQAREACDRAVRKAADLGNEAPRPWLEEYRKNGALKR